MSLNQVQLIGFLGQDPEKRVTQAGKEVFTLSVATSTKRKKEDGTIQELTEWHRVAVFNQVNFMPYLKKGDLVYIRGRLHYSQDEQQGVKRYFTQILCDDVQKLSRDEQREEQAPQNAPQTPKNQNEPPMDMDYDIPF